MWQKGSGNIYSKDIGLLKMDFNKIYQGNALEILKTFPNESIDCVITSPPYWALRDYGVEGQLGLEPTFHEYINKLCDIFEEAKRALKKSGTCWVNLGDTYGGSGNKELYHGGKGLDDNRRRQRGVKSGGNKEASKCLLQIPSRFSIEMCNRGWILRNTLIWHKPNCMPSSVKDRFTVDFEYVFFFVKNKKYWFERQIEPSEPWNSAKGFNVEGQRKRQGSNNTYGKDLVQSGRNKRCVWRICPKPFKAAHFAVFPEELVETPIKAGCPEFVCKKCGKGREKIYKKGKLIDVNKGRNLKPYIGGKDYQQTQTMSAGLTKGGFIPGHQYEQEFQGYTSCFCNVGFSPGTVLDPFIGSGTVAVVAQKLNRQWVGIELNSEYIKIAEKRIANHSYMWNKKKEVPDDTTFPKQTKRTG